jgi:hypothetical protein
MTRAAKRSIVFSLVIGMLTTFLLGWFCLYDQSGPQTPVPGATAQALWDRYAVANPKEHGPATFRRLSGAFGCDFIVLDAANGDPSQPAPPRMMITRMGLPFRAFEAMHSWGPVQPTHSGGYRVTPFNPNVSWVSIVPLKPMIAGFVLDTLFFAALAWTILFGPGAVMRRTTERMRLMRSHCPKCNYDLRGDLKGGCPECGWRREA